MIIEKGNLGATSYLDCLNSYSLTFIGLTIGILLLLVNNIWKFFNFYLILVVPYDALPTFIETPKQRPNIIF